MSINSESGTPPGVGQERQPERSWRLRSGYVLAFTNIMLGFYGSILIKWHGTLLTTYKINFEQYGFAGAVLLVVSVSENLTTEKQNVIQSNNNYTQWNRYHLIA